jgi:uncharacterized protein
MFLFVRELELRKIPFDVELEPGKIEFADELKQTTPLRATGVAELVSNTLGEIRIQGSLKVTMEAPCDRCLEPAAFPVDSKFDLFYQPDVPESAPGGEVHVAAGEIEIGFYDGDGLELEDVLVEQIVLSLPMQRVCKDTCKGICPVCGQNRNITGCSCQVKPVDTRWAAAFESLKK